MAGALRRIYERKYGKRGTDELDSRLFAATKDVFNHAAATGIAKAMSAGTPAPPEWFLHRIDQNNAIFSAFRTHRMQRDVAAKMFDAKGKIKPFDEFRRDVTPVIGKYRKDWLRTEYATAVQRARLAADWQQFVEESDVFPNLEWVPSTAIHPGADHRIFWNTIRPVGDAFWDAHRPGDRYNCQCDLRQTDLPETDVPTIPINDIKNSPAPGLDNNPGKDGRLFNDSHPYFATSCTSCPFVSMTKKLLALASGKKKNCYECRMIQRVIDGKEFNRETFKSGGVVEYPTKGKQNSNEKDKNETTVKILAKLYGRKYRLLPVINIRGKKNPDALNIDTNQLCDIKVPKGPNGKNAVQNSIKEASRQNAAEVIIHCIYKYSYLSILEGFKAALQRGRAKSVEKIIIIDIEKNIKEYNVSELRKILAKNKSGIE